MLEPSRALQPTTSIGEALCNADREKTYHPIRALG